jgi:predicted restriction endonuclease
VKKKKKYKSKSKLASIERKKKLKEWSLKARELDGNKCAICGKTENLNAHHILNKECKHYQKYQFDVNNAIILCVLHHKFDRRCSAHTNAIWFSEWLKENRPKQFEWCKERL